MLEKKQKATKQKVAKRPVKRKAAKARRPRKSRALARLDDVQGEQSIESLAEPMESSLAAPGDTGGEEWLRPSTWSMRRKLLVGGGVAVGVLFLLSRTKSGQKVAEKVTDTVATGAQAAARAASEGAQAVAQAAYKGVKFVTDSVENAIKTTLDFVLKAEGGFVDDPKDKGGATNKGITLKTYQSVKPGATVADLKKLTDADARAIYTALYITKPGFDKLPTQILPQVVDIGVNSGPGRAVMLLQKALNRNGQSLKVDGGLGPATIDAAAKVMQAVGVRKFNNDIADERIAFYRAIVQADPTQQKFLDGWLKRANTFKVAAIV